MPELLTKDDVSGFEMAMEDMVQELRLEFRKVGRETLISLTIIMGVLNAVFFTAYAIVLTG
jgi:hypothetical protein